MSDMKNNLIGAALIGFGVVGAALTGSKKPQRPDSERDENPESKGDGGISERTGLLAVIDRFIRRTRPLSLLFSTVKKYGEDDGAKLAATIAYFAFFSIFPALLALVSISGFVLASDPELQAKVVDNAVGQFPVVGDAVSQGGLSGSGFALAVGLAGAIWGGLSAMEATQRALNVVSGVPWHERTRGPKARIKGLTMFAVIGLSFVGSAVLTSIVAAAPIPGAGRFGIIAANIAVNVVVALLTFKLLNDAKYSARDLLPGAAIAGFMFYLLQTFGTLLIQRYVANASDTYGTFAVVIGLLSWFHLASQFTLIAAEFNVVRINNLAPRALVKDALCDGDQRTLAFHQRAAARHQSVEV